MKTITHWIDNRPYKGPVERTGPVFDPATGEQAGEVALATAPQVDEAVAAATRAFPGWRDTSLTRRQQVFFAYRDLLVRHRDELARIVSAEHGKTLDDARGEVQRGIEVVEFVCGVPHLLKGDFSENVSTNIDMHTIRQPLGVCAGITPFNFPVMVPLWMYPLAIACGNTFVLKPSEKDPSVSVRAAELFAEAGLPDGVLNVVHGDREAVERLLVHPDVAGVSFVGSTPIARSIYEKGSQAGKRVQALGGAKNHMIVLPDADMDLAADSAVSAGYGSAGERCMAISVVVTVGPAGDELVPKLTERIGELRVGPGLEADSDMGPLVTAAHRDRVVGYIQTGVDEGAKLLADGRELSGHGEGFFLGPTLFDEVAPEMTIYTDEIFGPVLSVLRCASYEDAIALINANPYGNGTAIFTNDGGAARKFQNEIEVGMVGINIPIPVPLSFYSFGGWKQSMFGAHDVYGPDGIRFNTRTKSIISRWPDPMHRGVNLGFPTNS